MIEISKDGTPVKVLNLPITGPYAADWSPTIHSDVVTGPGFLAVCDGEEEALLLASRMNNAFIMGTATALLSQVSQ